MPEARKLFGFFILVNFPFKAHTQPEADQKSESCATGKDFDHVCRNGIKGRPKKVQTEYDGQDKKYDDCRHHKYGLSFPPD